MNTTTPTATPTAMPASAALPDDVLNARIVFVSAFNEIQLGAHTINVKNGWWDDRLLYLESGLPNANANTVCALVGLAHTELSETIEAARKHPMETWGDSKTKDTMVRELAGTVVRVMDLAQAFRLPLAEAIIEELKANASRGFRHGGKAA